MPTRPGVNPKFEYDRYTYDEKAIINRLSRHFYITRAMENIEVGNSDYRAFLMRPSDNVSVILNVEREIVVLLADYETFEARTLNAFDRVYERFDDNRIDKTIRFLVSRDSRIEESIRHYLQQDPEYPIIIPFRYDDFLHGSNDSFIFRGIRGNFLTRDLFGYQSPLRHEYYFFGRTELSRQVLDTHSAGQNTGLFGLRKSGKTSTIYAIQRQAKSSGYSTFVVDCQDPSVHGRRYYELLAYIVESLRRLNNLKRQPISLGTTPGVVSDNFREVMVRTLGELRSSVLIMFDEIENISPKTAASPHWRSGEDTLLFWQTLRSFFQNAGKYGISFCFVGTNPHLFEMPKINDVDNPVYLFASMTYLQNLSFDETREMCEKLGYFMGMDFDPNVIAYIHQQFGGHPFFTRQLCSNIHKLLPHHRPAEVPISLCIKAQQKASANIRSYMKEILDSLNNFYPEEMDMLRYLACGEIETFNEIARKYPEFTEHLCGYNIILQRGDVYEFAFDAVRSVATEDLSLGKPGIDQIWSEIVTRRGRLEQEIRVALYHWAVGLADNDWKEAYQKALPKRTTDGGVQAPRVVFGKSSSPLYLIDLLRFVEVSGLHSSQEIVRGEIKSAINKVNSLRVDAHAKAISEDQLKELRHALDLLESIFLPPE